MAGRDAIEFITAADCKDAAREIAIKVANFSGQKPSEEEVLARCRHVFEAVLHYSIHITHPESDLEDYEVEIQNEKE